jgi:hypothetical protein
VSSTLRRAAAFAVLGLAACGPSEPETTSRTIELFVDPDGIFVSAEPVRGEWFAGYDVQCLLPPLGQTDGQHIVGRLAGEQPILISRTDGAMDSLQPVLTRVSGPHVDALQKAAAAAFLDGLPGDTATTFARAVQSATAEPAPPVPEPRAPRAEPASRRDPPLPAGAPLIAWAPGDCLVVRFRSVEAGFRFGDLADRLALKCADPLGAARDHGTLRLTLHHLLLPSIWKANPGGPKGVRECALIVPPPFRPGAMRAAVVLRIVDETLHDQETQAGVALEARPDHLWRPDGDPFPEERVRTAVRAIAGDVEVVATDAELLEAILAGPGRTGDGWTQEAVAARHELPAPTRRRAFTLLGAPEVHVDRHTAWQREHAGARALAERWLGLRVPHGEVASQPPPAPESVWSQVVAAAVDTDAQGALVTLRMRTADDAADVRDLLVAPPAIPAAAFEGCRRNLAALAPLGIVDPRCTDVPEAALVWFGWKPVCADGGRYRFHPGTGAVSCSVHGTFAESVGFQTAPPASPASEVEVDGERVTFRLSIDW